MLVLVLFLSYFTAILAVIDPRQFHFDKGSKILLCQNHRLLEWLNSSSGVEDEETKIGIAIDVGSYHDPIDTQGLAHLFEHSIFLGSKGYNDTFDQHLLSQGGITNAATFSDKIVVGIKSHSNSLQDTLSRALDMILNPRLEDTKVLAELNNVNSEHLRNKLDQNHQAWTAVISQFKYPLSKFSTGDLRTLNKKDIVDRLRSFHSHYISPSKLSIFSTSDLPTEVVLDNMKKSLNNPIALWTSNQDAQHDDSREDEWSSLLAKCTKQSNAVDDYCLISLVEPDEHKLIKLTRGFPISNDVTHHRRPRSGRKQNFVSEDQTKSMDFVWLVPGSLRSDVVSAFSELFNIDESESTLNSKLSKLFSAPVELDLQMMPLNERLNIVHLNIDISRGALTPSQIGPTWRFFTQHVASIRHNLADRGIDYIHSFYDYKLKTTAEQPKDHFKSINNLISFTRAFSVELKKRLPLWDYNFLPDFIDDIEGIPKSNRYPTIDEIDRNLIVPTLNAKVVAIVKGWDRPRYDASLVSVHGSVIQSEIRPHLMRINDYDLEFSVEPLVINATDSFTQDVSPEIDTIPWRIDCRYPSAIDDEAYRDRLERTYSFSSSEILYPRRLNILNTPNASVWHSEMFNSRARLMKISMLLNFPKAKEEREEKSSYLDSYLYLFTKLVKHRMNSKFKDQLKSCGYEFRMESRASSILISFNGPESDNMAVAMFSELSGIFEKPLDELLTHNVIRLEWPLNKLIDAAMPKEPETEFDRLIDALFRITYPEKGSYTVLTEHLKKISENHSGTTVSEFIHFMQSNLLRKYSVKTLAVNVDREKWISLVSQSFWASTGIELLPIENQNEEQLSNTKTGRLTNFALPLHSMEISLKPRPNIVTDRSNRMIDQQEYLHGIFTATTLFCGLEDDADSQSNNNTLWIMQIVLPTPTIRDKLCFKVLTYRLNQYLFQNLRTREHIGYVVDASDIPLNSFHRSLIIRIQSPTLTARQINSKLNSTLQEFVVEQQQKPQDTFVQKSQIVSSASDLLYRPDDTYAEFDYFWHFIVDSAPQKDGEVHEWRYERSKLNKIVNDQEPLLEKDLTKLSHLVLTR